MVSFQSEPWELYNIAKDRTELHNVAAEHPDVLSRRVKQWHAMAKDVLMANPKEQSPVAETASGHVHREWSVYNQAANTSSRGKDAKGKNEGKKKRNQTETSKSSNQ